MSGGNIKFGVWKFEEPVFEITRDDLFFTKDKPPITVSKRDPANAYNLIKVKWTDRDKESGWSVAISDDAVDRRRTGITKQKQYNLLGITNAELAAKTAYRLRVESMYRISTYTFTLSYRNMTIEVGDVGLLSDGDSICKERIRITRLPNEKEDGKEIAVEAVEDREFLYLLPLLKYSENLHERYVKPELVEPNVYLSEREAEPVINFHICPQDEYFTGFGIYYSFDNDTYEHAGSCMIAKMSCNIDGTITAALPSHPAVIYKPLESFELAQNVSFIDLQPATDSQFFNNQLLMKIEDEVLAYKDVVASEDSYADWKVSSLIRGLFNTEATSHSIGKTWHTMISDFKFRFSPEDIGKTIYFKVLTGYAQDIIQLEDATPIEYVIKGSYRKPLSVSITRIVGREGLETFKTDEFDVKINLAGKEAGWNIGGLGISPFGIFVRDATINSIELQIKKLNDDLIYSEAMEVEGSSVSEYSKTITVAMRNGNDPVQVSLTPAAFVAADERRIEADDIRS